MRVFFFSFFFILLVFFSTALTINSITGNIPNDANCVGGHTYAFYRTPAEQDRVIDMYLQAGFIPVAYDSSPDSFRESGYDGFLCMRRMTNKELEETDYYRAQLRPRDRVVTWIK